MNQIRLEACPFCGCEGLQVTKTGKSSWIGCPRCAAEGPVSYKGADDAARLWNDRIAKIEHSSAKAEAAPAEEK